MGINEYLISRPYILFGQFKGHASATGTGYKDQHIPNLYQKKALFDSVYSSSSYTAPPAPLHGSHYPQPLISHKRIFPCSFPTANNDPLPSIATLVILPNGAPLVGQFL